MNSEGLKMILEGVCPDKVIMLMNQDGEPVGTIDAIDFFEPYGNGQQYLALWPKQRKEKDNE